MINTCAWEASALPTELRPQNAFSLGKQRRQNDTPAERCVQDCRFLPPIPVETGMDFPAVRGEWPYRRRRDD